MTLTESSPSFAGLRQIFGDNNAVSILIEGFPGSY
jgi:hypothetical protein